MSNNTSAIIVAMAVVCLIAVTIPVAMIATQDDGGSESFEVTLYKDGSSGMEVDWNKALKLILDSKPNYMASAKMITTDNGIVCTITDTSIKADKFKTDMEGILSGLPGYDKFNAITESGEYHGDDPITTYPEWEIRCGE